MPSLQELLEDIENDLTLAKDVVGSSPGPLDPDPRKQVSGYLDSSELGISAVLVIIDDAGEVAVPLPLTLPAIAALCVTLSHEARVEGDNSPPNEEYIGDRMKSIRWLINTRDGYRDRI